MVFNLTQPVTWSDIISAAVALFTFAAVVVAVIANHKATQQLKSALAMQEQSKNTELLSLRVSMAEQVEQDNYIPEMTIRLLFNSEIYKSYQKLCSLEQLQKEAEHDEKVYFDATEQMDADGYTIHPIKASIAEYESFMSRSDCPGDIFDKYRKFCDENEIYWSETGLSDDRRTYNHAEISERISQASQRKRQEKAHLLMLMENYIASSIQPLN